MQTKPQGLCPHCGSYDNLHVCGPVPLTRVALQSPEFNGTGGTNATIYLHDKHDRPFDSIPAPAKFYCDNCNQYFDTPVFKS